MFKIGAFTDELARDADNYCDLVEACEVCNAFGVEGVELRNVWNKMAQDFTPDEVRETRKILGDYGLVVCSMGSWFGKCDLDNPTEVAANMDLLRRASDVSLELGCSLVRGFAFWDHEQVDEKPWDEMFKAYAPVPAILEEMGVTLGLENESSCYVGTAPHLRTFLDKLGCPRVKVVWDPANHVHDPQDPDLPAFPDGYDLIKDDLVHVHMKDAIPNDQGGVSGAFVGMGACRWPEQFQALMADGYDGFVSLETHIRAEECPDEFKAKYGRYLTKEGRPGASQVCLAWVRDVLTELT